MTGTSQKEFSRRRGVLFGIAGLAAVLLAGGAFFGLYPRNGSNGGGACVADQKMIDALKPLATGEVAAFNVASRRSVFPALAFQTPDGQPTGLSQFKGKVVLLNLWATWCVPCRLEMPALDRLQREFGGEKFEVVAINVDTAGGDKPRRWLADNGIKNLAFYADPKGVVLKTLQKSGHVVGLPTTILLDASGCETGILKGGADWVSEDAVRLIRTAAGLPE